MRYISRVRCLAGILTLCAAATIAATDENDKRVEVNGVVVQLVGYQGPATVSAEETGRFEVRISIEPAGEEQPLRVSVVLPATGPRTWPAEDVEVLDGDGHPVAVERSGIEWHKLAFTAPPAAGPWLVHAVSFPEDETRRHWPREDRRNVTDPESGLGATVCRWFDDRRAAFSLRFDDSHPTHLSTVIPILREYGFSEEDIAAKIASGAVHVKSD